MSVIQNEYLFMHYAEKIRLTFWEHQGPKPYAGPISIIYLLITPEF